MTALARNTDPETSHLAARNQSDHRAACIVKAIMERERRDMTDEGIALVYADQPLCWGPVVVSNDRLRHGRKHLERLGMVLRAGRSRTSSGASAQLWRLA